MPLYPSLPAARRATVARDLALVGAIVVFAALGLSVNHAVDRLASLGQGVTDAGTAVQDGFRRAAGATSDVPIVGGPLSDGLRSAGSATGGSVADTGRRGEDSAHRLANLLGLVVWLLPSSVLLAFTLPGRIRQVRRLTAVTSVLTGLDDPERRRLVAMRAAFALPYQRLARHSADPLGDLHRGAYDGLIAAALEDAELGQGDGATLRTRPPT